MRIGLIDVDGHNFPNLPLMKLSAWHKQNGDNVDWCVPLLKYDKVYVSKVFDFTPDFDTAVNTKELIRGGTGYDLKNVLPDEVETMFPDYNLYPQYQGKAYGFLTRGCPNNCPFCIVTPKEGRLVHKVADITDFWSGQKEIILLDANMTAYKNTLELCDQLIETKALITFSQGLDMRFMTEDFAHKIQQMKIKMLHFAWDLPKFEKIIVENLQTFRKYWDLNERNLRVYVLTNYNTDLKYDLYRIYKLKELGYDPYVMIFNKQTAPRITRKLQRWVNNKFIFRTCDKFEDYRGGKK